MDAQFSARVQTALLIFDSEKFLLLLQFLSFLCALLAGLKLTKRDVTNQNLAACESKPNDIWLVLGHCWSPDQNTPDTAELTLISL